MAKYQHGRQLPPSGYGLKKSADDDKKSNRRQIYLQSKLGQMTIDSKSSLGSKQTSVSSSSSSSSISQPQKSYQHESSVKSSRRNKHHNNASNIANIITTAYRCSLSSDNDDDNFSTRQNESRRLTVKITKQTLSSLSPTSTYKLKGKHRVENCSHMRMLMLTKLMGLAIILLICNNHSSSVVAQSNIALPLESDIGNGKATGSEPAHDDIMNGAERLGPYSPRDSRDARLGEKLQVNTSHIFDSILKKKPYSKYWTAEQKWDDLFRRILSVQDTMKAFLMKNMLRDAEYYADLSLSKACEDDLKFIQLYARRSKNFRWLLHMLDSTGKSEPGMLTGNLAQMGHVIQCIKVRAPSRPSNDSFDERFFEQQTKQLGERFRGKYCLASIRPVLPPKPHLVSRFSAIFNDSLLSNVSYLGEPIEVLKQRAKQLTVPPSVYDTIDRKHLRLDQVPFESQLFAYLLAQKNFMFSLPRYMGVCYPSSCSREDVRVVLQKSMDDQHQVVDVEFDCEQEDNSLWEWLITPRLLSYVILGILVSLVVLASMARHIIVDRLQIRAYKLSPDSGLVPILHALDLLSMDKCAGILFIKTKRASPFVDWTRVENNRSASIDALKGLLILASIYSQLVFLGCLPLPFMWSKWNDAMFPFYRSFSSQFFLNMNIWTESFYIISAYLITLKVLENYRPRFSANNGYGYDPQDAMLFKQPNQRNHATMLIPNFFSFAMKRYVRLVLPMIAFILLNYVWPQLSNGFVMQDQANKLMSPCDSIGWTNLLLFHNQYGLNETCLWPTHVSASFFQLHLISYPLVLLCLMCLYGEFNQQANTMALNANNCNNINSITSSGRKQRKTLLISLRLATIGLAATLALLGAIIPAYKASGQELIVSFLIDYIDYDNYQKVIEWMVMPTYNHLTSYMFGIMIAFVVMQKRSRREQRLSMPASLSDSWLFNSGASVNVAAETAGIFINREGSLESVRSSSTQELHSSDGGIVASFHKSHGLSNTNQQVAQCKLKFSVSSGTSSTSGEQQDRIFESNDSDECSHWISDALKSVGAILLAYFTLSSTWFWNGLGQPMSSNQTFWYVMVTKLIFCSTFSYLFYKYFATRRNYNNPWMITRFLVPIGRMSLTTFYVSWLVIWFDLLSSPYQWHPSHYFVFEKFTETIFLTLILSMFVYGAFEGILKRTQYAARIGRVSRDKKYLASMKTSNQQQPVQIRRQQVKCFESFFDPMEKKMLQDDKPVDSRARSVGEDKQQQLGQNKQQQTIVESQMLADSLHRQHYQMTKSAHQRATNKIGSLTPGRTQSASGSGNQRSNLSTVDQYKLNAELRANYSFASIGLYESAGATADLTQFHGSQASIDPQVSPAPSRSDDQK